VQADRKTAMAQSVQATRRTSPFIYGLGAMGLQLMTPAFAAYFTFYYVDVLGLAVVLAAAINTVYGLWDAVNDPLFGYLSDNTRTRWGRRRPWLTAGIPFYSAFLILVFAVPGSLRDGQWLFLYALVTALLYETASTVVGTNYQALFPELFGAFHERTRASAYTHGLGMVGELAGFALTPYLYARLGFAGMAVSYGIVGGGLLMLGVSRNREDPRAQTVPTVNPAVAFKEVFTDRLFWHVTLVATATWFTTGVFTMATPFYTRYTLAAAAQAPSYLFGTVFVTAIAAVPLWTRVIPRHGLKRLWVTAIGFMALSAVALGLAPGLAVALGGALLAGIGLGGVKVCREMTLAGLVDLNLRRTGRRSEAVYYGLNRFMGKISRVLDAVALVAVGALFGYVSGSNRGPMPGLAFRFLMGAVPLSLLLAGLALALRLPRSALETAREGHV
jgi:GPH family glycoside/pentoside/hexuronide:cation symporter